MSGFYTRELESSGGDNYIFSIRKDAVISVDIRVSENYGDRYKMIFKTESGDVTYPLVVSFSHAQKVLNGVTKEQLCQLIKYH